MINQPILKKGKTMETTEKLELPAGCSLEFTGPSGKSIKLMSIDELKKVVDETKDAQKRELDEKKKLIEEDCKKKLAALSDVIEKVYHAMADDKCVCQCKEIHEQFAFFVNKILLPNTMPEFQCIIEPVVEQMYDLEGVPVGSRTKGVHLVYVTKGEYDDYWKSRKEVAARRNCGKKCLASKSDLKKINDAIAKDAPIHRVSASSIVPLAQLLLSKNSSQSEVTVAINTFLDFIASKYGVVLAEEIVGTDTVQRVADVLNLVIKFVNKKFNKNIKTIKDTDKFGRRINACISILKILKAIKQSKKTEKK